MNVGITITLVKTGNSVYQYAREHGTVRGLATCLTGTNQGWLQKVSFETWTKCHPVVGEELILISRSTGKEFLHTTRVSEIQVINPDDLERDRKPRPVANWGTSLGEALAAHVRGVMHPQAVRVPEVAKPVVLEHTHPVYSYDIWTEKFGWVTKDRVKGCKACGHQGVDLWTTLSEQKDQVLDQNLALRKQRDRV